MKRGLLLAIALSALGGRAFAQETQIQVIGSATIENYSVEKVMRAAGCDLGWLSKALKDSNINPERMDPLSVVGQKVVLKGARCTDPVPPVVAAATSVILKNNRAIKAAAHPVPPVSRSCCAERKAPLRKKAEAPKKPEPPARAPAPQTAFEERPILPSPRLPIPLSTRPGFVPKPEPVAAPAEGPKVTVSAQAEQKKRLLDRKALTSGAIGFLLGCLALLAFILYRDWNKECFPTRHRIKDWGKESTFTLMGLRENGSPGKYLTLWRCDQCGKKDLLFKDLRPHFNVCKKVPDGLDEFKSEP